LQSASLSNPYAFLKQAPKFFCSPINYVSEQMNADMAGAMKGALQKGTWMAALFSVGPSHQRLSAV
jgi:hypothetical protein